MKHPLLVALLLSSAAAEAAVLVPVDGTTSGGVSFGAIANVIDGIPDFESYVVFGPIDYGSFTGPYTIRFDLGGDFVLTGMNLWNNAGNLDADGEGVKNFTLTFRDSALETTGAASGVAADLLAMQNFSFAPRAAAFVDFTLESQHDEIRARQYVTFHEINFVTAIPEPAAAGLALGTAVIACVGLRRRIRT